MFQEKSTIQSELISIICSIVIEKHIIYLHRGIAMEHHKCIKICHTSLSQKNKILNPNIKPLIYRVLLLIALA